MRDEARREGEEPPVFRFREAPGRGAQGGLAHHVISIPARDGGATYNNYLLVSPSTNEAVLIDAAGEPSASLDVIQRLRARVRMILLTHGHAGHWRALGALRDALGVPVGVHLDDVDMLPLTPNFALAANQSIAFGASRALVLHTPGHTPGSVCFLAENVLVAGDTLPLAQSTPVLSADAPATLAQSIHRELLPLTSSVLILPGHGASSTLGSERTHLTNWVAAHQP